MAKRLTIHIAVISHRHGLNTYVSRTYEGLRRQIAEYVVEYWDDECRDETIPASRGRAIDRYFELAEDEWLETSTAELGD